MLIDFEASGGFANLRLTYHMNTDVLSPAQAAELSQFVEGSGFFDLEQSTIAPTEEGPPDVIVYRLSVFAGGRQKSLSFNDVTAPASLRPLLALLQELALNERRKGK